MNFQMSLASALALALLHSLWQLALLGLLAALSFAAMRRATAAARHAVGMAWLLTMALAPVATFALCWHAPSLRPIAGTPWQLLLAQAEPAAGTLPALPVLAPGASWLLVCLAQLWLVGVVVMGVRQIGGWRWIRRIEHEAFTALPDDWQRQVDAMCAALGIVRRVRVRLAAHVASPFTAHALRPLVWLPLALLTRLPVEQVEALLAHELAHIRRLDWCWNALQCAIEALLFHHPAMWWLSRRIRDEREHACDDLAVAVCGDAVVLAEALAALPLTDDHPACNPRPGRRPPPMALAAGGGSLMKRVTHLLAPAPSRPNWRVPGALLLLLGCGSLLAMQVAPPAHLLTNLTTEASSAGDLTPGNHREFSARYLGEKTRRYRIAMDAQGRVSERYSEDNVPKPIDDNVRQWLAAMTAMSAPVAVPAAPAVPPLPNVAALPAVPAVPSVPPVAPLPATPPRPPAPPAASLSDESRALVDAIRADARVTALTGTPVRFDRGSLKGSIRIWGSRDFRLWGIDDPVGGKAAFSARFDGPDGAVDVAYAGRTVSGGAWRAETFTVSPVPR